MVRGRHEAATISGYGGAEGQRRTRKDVCRMARGAAAGEETPLPHRALPLQDNYSLLERAAADAEAIYRSFYENAVEGIYRTTPEGRYLSVNPALARIYGY